MLTTGDHNVRGTWLVLGSAVMVAVGVVAAIGLVGRAPVHSAPLPSSELLPDATAIQYRFSIDAPDHDDLASTIAALEERAGRPDLIGVSPFDLAELAELYFRRAQLAGDARDHEAARAMAKRSLALLPAPNPAVVVLAKLANARHDFREAIALAREALARSPSRAAYLVLATAHLALGELAEAGEAAETALGLAPDSGGYLLRALVMQAQGRDVEAAFDFARAVAVEEHGARAESARLRALWARFLLRRGEPAGAGLLLDEALRIAPGHPLAVGLRGELALRTGKPAAARAWFEEAFVTSRQVRYLIDQARAQQVDGDRAGADALRDQVERLVRGELGEGGLGHRLELVEILVERGRAADLVEAIALARAEVALRPSADARFELARALARGGQEAEARGQVRAALASGAREAPLYELAAQLEQQRGNAARATLYAREAARLDPSSGLSSGVSSGVSSGRSGTGWRQLAGGLGGR